MINEQSQSSVGEESTSIESVLDGTARRTFDPVREKTYAPTGTDEFVPGPDENLNGFERTLWDIVDTIPDPHIPVSLVEMGMIYNIAVDGGHVTAEMSFPCMGCPAYDMLIDEVQNCLLSVSDVETVDVDVVWEPVWSKELLAPEVREKIRAAGVGL